MTKEDQLKQVFEIILTNQAGLNEEDTKKLVGLLMREVKIRVKL
ncbi:unnamed protein product [marine sediment metagenome]|uniref:Uncharacterized protein n=1 Tax=marine sediment metagenome TaxID=412755 RepID=X1AWQ3_9ZZZZ